MKDERTFLKIYFGPGFSSGDISYCVKSVKNNRWYDIFGILRSENPKRIEYNPLLLRGEQLQLKLDECARTKKTLNITSELNNKRIKQIIYLGDSKAYHADRFCELLKYEDKF